MSDIYLSLTETPSVVTLSQPVVASVMVNTVTVANVVSVNVVTMPAINVTAAGGLTNAELRASAVSVAVTTMPALSISSVSISNFPATQPISGTVTANIGSFIGPALFDGLNDYANNYNVPWRVDGDVGVSGTVTANVLGTKTFIDNNAVTVSDFLTVGGWDDVNAVYAPLRVNDGGTGIRAVPDPFDQTPFPVYGAVTANVDVNSRIKVLDSNGDDLVVNPINGGLQTHINNSLTIGSLPPISGTVTANNPSGALTTRFGSVTTANTAQLTSAVTNTSRKYLLVQNIASATVTIGIGFAPTTTQGIQLTAGAGLTFDAFCPTGGVWWLSGVTSSNFCVIEG